ncbi:hypothetical protein BaOVIS_015020 [Babesia ovis]|uniref:SUEL-type lectin domain-containing protein n=1 Tax=Babesia ovis TaxID=5869 RepID=A0A9W5TA68_BABOV|nr:hypothetical protein BaOVIS_015020 [Babesia ovis]
MYVSKIPIALLASASLAAIFAKFGSATSNVGNVVKCRGQHTIYVEDEGLYEIKCTKDQEMHVVEAYGVCNEDIISNNITASKSFRRESLSTAFTRYCPPFFSKNEKCVIHINKKVADAQRFLVGNDLTCKKGVTFIGLYHCCDKEKSAIEPGEVVTLAAKKEGTLSPRCPPGKKINVITSGQRGTFLCNKGHITSTTQKAAELCNNKEMCNITFGIVEPDICPGNNTSHFVKYTCV